MQMKKNTTAVVWFLIGSILIFFSNGKWILPTSIWIVTIGFLRFTRTQKSQIGFISVLAISFLSNIFIWDGIIPLPSPLYYIVCLIGGVFFSLPFLIDRLLAKKLSGVASTIVYPCSSLFFAYLYSRISPSGTYGSLAYTQTNIEFLQIVSVAGIWGVLFTIGWTAAVIVFVMENFHQFQKVKLAVLCYLSFVGIVLVYGNVKVHFPKNEQETVRVAGIVNDFEFNKSIKDNIQEFKTYSRLTEDKLMRESKISAQTGAKIIFWQETALVVLKEDEDSLLSRTKEFAAENNIYIGLSILSIPAAFPNEPGENKIIWITPERKIGLQYSKAYPTPSENVIPGARIAQSFDTEFGKLSSAICFDLDFPSYMREFGRKGVDILLVPANDWKEITPYHAHIALFRAIENGFSVVRATGKGLSVSYDANGSQNASLNYFTTHHRTMIADVPIQKITTAYSYGGDFLPWMSLISILLLIVTALKTKSTRSHNSAASH
jgi:apolipoprotein N-acyltransferase